MQYEISIFNGTLSTQKNLISLSDPGRMPATRNVKVSPGGLESVYFFVPTEFSKLLTVNKYLSKDDFCFKYEGRERIWNNILSKGNVRIYSWVLSLAHLSKVIFLKSKTKTNP